VSADPKENKMYMWERVREVVVRNWKIMPIQILATIGEKMGEKMGKKTGKTSLSLVGMQPSTFSWIAILFSMSPFSPIIYIFPAKFYFFFLHRDINEGSQFACNTQSLDIDITGFTATQRDGTQEIDITGLQVNKMMMKHKVCRVLICTSNFFSTRNNLLSSKVASYTFFT